MRAGPPSATATAAGAGIAGFGIGGVGAEPGVRVEAGPFNHLESVRSHPWVVLAVESSVTGKRS
jgi:hypothetical protein